MWLIKFVIRWNSSVALQSAQRAASKYSIPVLADSAMSEASFSIAFSFSFLAVVNLEGKSYSRWVNYVFFCGLLAIGAFVIVEMLFSSSLLAIVGAGEEVRCTI